MNFGKLRTVPSIAPFFRLRDEEPRGTVACASLDVAEQGPESRGSIA